MATRIIPVIIACAAITMVVTESLYYVIVVEDKKIDPDRDCKHIGWC
jgi:hypothetical protein